ncbi:hypothetical protein ACFL4V_00300 [Candidatus Latescibacterota bacterium]
MNTSGGKNDALVTRAIIAVSVIGILYFGYRAVSENPRENQKNPFEYTIEDFKEIDTKLLQYSEIGQIPLNFQQVSGIDIEFEDTIYVTADESVLIMSNEGQLQSTVSTSETVRCIDVDENGDLYLGMDDHVEVYAQNGIKKAHWKSLGDEALITSIAVSNENVFIADAGSHTVWKYDKSGNVIIKLANKDESKDILGCVIPGQYFDMSFDPDGFLWIVNPGRHSLENYTMDGDLRSFWGEYSMEIEGFCGCCNPTHIAIFDDGKFVTSEKGIPRIKVYNRLGNLESVVAGPDQFIEGTEGLDLALDSSGRIYVLDPVKKAIRIFEKNNQSL